MQSIHTPLKATLRASMRIQRHALNAKTRAEKAVQLANIVSLIPEFIQSHHLAAYSAFDAEIDPFPLLKQAEALNKTCYLGALEEKKVAFLKYATPDVLSPNPWGILEPKTSHKVDIQGLDLILLPLVAFDKGGYRLGMGGGYYDRTLAQVDFNQEKRPFLIGLGYEMQAVDCLPIDPWDIPLDAIATEARFIRLQRA